MKLKKIASLALAGVMAVSMLAGCANKPGTTDDNQGTQTETTVSIADVLNANVSADNQKKVTFTDDASLATALEKAIEKLGASTGTATGNTTTADTNLLKEVAKTIGAGADFDYGQSSVTVTPNDYTAFNDDGTDAVTVLKLYRIAAGDDNLNMEKYLVNQLVDKVDPDLDDLKLTTKEGKNPGDTYYDYSYTGKATVLVQKADNGAIYYLVLTSVTRTGTEAKLPEA